MREFDHTGLALCRLQGELFERSLESFGGGSAIFVRRFMNSSVAKRMDEGGFPYESSSLESLLAELDAEYGPSDYGTKKFDAEALYWMGYLYRYWSYVFETPSASVYKIAGAREMKGLYFPYHSLDPEQAVERILEAKGCPREGDVVERGVAALRAIRESGRFEYAVVVLPEIVSEDDPALDARIG